MVMMIVDLSFCASIDAKSYPGVLIVAVDGKWFAFRFMYRSFLLSCINPNVSHFPFKLM